MRFGRIDQPDERDKLFMLSAILPKKPSALKKRYWDDNNWWGNQGDTSQCVAYAWEHWIDDPPVVHAQVPMFDPAMIYEEAKLIDGIKGPHEGTTVRAGAKTLKARGLIKEYRWTWSTKVVEQCILQLGPMVIGTDWYEDMFYPDQQGRISIGGQLAGGHAYLLNGVDTVARRFRIKNSWGKEWGQGGHAHIRYSDLARLLFPGGEACIAVELA
jgi:hypothetical protein